MLLKCLLLSEGLSNALLTWHVPPMRIYNSALHILADVYGNPCRTMGSNRLGWISI